MNQHQTRSRAESTQDVIFLLRYRASKKSQIWRVDSVWLDRQEAETFAKAHEYRWRHWQVYGVPANGDLVKLLMSQELLLGPPESVVAPDLSRDWAVAPLLDVANIGRYVWFSFSGNELKPEQVTGIGRTNIHLATRPVSSLRVHESGQRAVGMSGRDSVSAISHAQKIEQDRAERLRKLIQPVAWHRLSAETLSRVVTALRLSGELAD